MFISEPEGDTILDILKSDEDATEIYALLEKAMEQYSVFVYLFGPRDGRTEIENITFFAPTNAALQKFRNVSGKDLFDRSYYPSHSTLYCIQMF